MRNRVLLSVSVTLVAALLLAGCGGAFAAPASTPDDVLQRHKQLRE